ncbi:MAG: penicillin-binding transpeptidase domain-containing protein [Actinomadura sp.]
MGRNKLLLIVPLVTTLLLAAGGAGAYWLLRTKGSPGETAAAFLAAWERGDTAAMGALVAVPPADLAARHQDMRTSLGITKATFTPGPSRRSGSAARVPYTATLGLKSGGTWSYTGELVVTDKDRRWQIAWTPATLHPKLREGQRFLLAATWPDRGTVLAADGSRMDIPGVSGSVQQLAGTLGPATADDLKRLGPPYKAGTQVGHGGIQQAMERRLAGVPQTSIQIVGADKRPVATIGRIAGRPGTEVRTSLDPKIQAAAARAITGQRKPAALVALRPSTGEILAAANQPGGWSRALMGQYPPGSTFKVVTAAALLRDGLGIGDRVNCTKTANIGGRSFRNFEGEEFGQIDFRTAFAHSCNTVFAGETIRRLDEQQLVRAAQDFGFGTPITPGIAAQRGRFPMPRDDAEFAAASFGQGRILVSPLNMAAVAAAVADGTWRSPRLVTGNDDEARVRKLDPGVVAGLRTMMAAVVTEGTAKGARLPAGTAGKTGTAEYGSGAEPETHAWFIGYRGDLAFAVIIEGGGTGGDVAAPIAGAFLRAL